MLFTNTNVINTGKMSSNKSVFTVLVVFSLVFVSFQEHMIVKAELRQLLFQMITLQYRMRLVMHLKEIQYS